MVVTNGLMGTTGEPRAISTPPTEDTVANTTDNTGTRYGFEEICVAAAAGACLLYTSDAADE